MHTLVHKDRIAPAMKTDGRKIFWGADFAEDLDERSRKLLGKKRELNTPGSNARITQGRQEAVDLLEDPEAEGLTARQLMLKHKAAHGSGNDPTYPDADTIDANMRDYPADFKVDIYGDGSYTTPAV